MAGAGYKLFNTGDVLTAAQVNTYLQEQTVMVFASSAARTSALSGVLAEGMVSYLLDTNAVEVYNGTAWVGIAADQTPLTTKGDLFGFSTVDARIPIGTNGQVLIADSAQSLGLKWGVDPTTDVVTTAGDLIYGTAADTVARLGIGTAGQVLKVNSGATAPEWAAPVTGSMTLLHTLTLNATSTTQSTISQAYKNLYIVGKNIGVTSSGDALRVRFAGRTGNYQGTRIEQANITALSASGVDSVSNDLSSTNGSAFHFTCFDYAETSSEKLITGQSVGNNTGNTCFYNISPFNLQTNIASVTITTVGGTLTMSGTVEIYGVN